MTDDDVGPHDKEWNYHAHAGLDQIVLTINLLVIIDAPGHIPELEPHRDDGQQRPLQLALPVGLHEVNVVDMDEVVGTTKADADDIVEAKVILKGEGSA